jgi:hypothetical protein
MLLYPHPVASVARKNGWQEGDGGAASTFILIFLYTEVFLSLGWAPVLLSITHFAE